MLAKDEIRSKNKAARAAMDRAEVKMKSHSAAEVFLASEIYKNARQIMLYMPLGNETDTSEIIKAAFSDGKKVIFPVTDAKSGEITPYYATGNTEFIKGAFSVSEPCGTDVADMTKTDVIIIPGVAFDKKGSRVGFGKGCYDRFLRKCSAIKIGFCYAFQICEEIEADAHDVNMDFLVTENGMIECK